MLIGLELSDLLEAETSTLALTGFTEDELTALLARPRRRRDR